MYNDTIITDYGVKIYQNIISYVKSFLDFTMYDYIFIGPNGEQCFLDICQIDKVLISYDAEEKISLQEYMAMIIEVVNNLKNVTYIYTFSSISGRFIAAILSVVLNAGAIADVIKMELSPTDVPLYYRTTSGIKGMVAIACVSDIHIEIGRASCRERVYAPV